MRRWWWWLLAACADPDPDAVDDTVETEETEAPDTDPPPLCDADQDGWGAPGAGCLPVAVADCDDDDARVHPEAEERCNGVDEDCSGAADEAFDADGDGQAGCAGDCDDGDPRRAEVIPEQCDGQDNDCDEEVDEGYDSDGDGVAACRGDCDDADPAIYIGLPELCDGVDNDCDPTTTEDGDADGDGVTMCAGDCDDRDARTFPGNPEVCDLVDNDCDGRGDVDPACFGCAELAPGLLMCGLPVDWHAAAQACADFGGALAMPKTSEANALLSGLVAPWGAVWIGLSDEAVEAQWTWVDGTLAGDQLWWPGEPNNCCGGEHCVGTNFGAEGYWNDYTCTTVLPFVCQMPL